MNRSVESLKAFVSGAERPSSWRPVPGVVVVGAGKGGVGTSLISTLLAVEAARAGESVLLVDAAEGVGSLHLMLGVSDAGPGLEALRGGNVAAEALVVSVASGLDLFPGGAEPNLDGGPGERRALMRRVSRLFRRYSMVVIDAGSRVESVMAACRAGAERLLCVTARDRLSLAASYALLKTARSRVDALPVELIVNRVGEQEARSVYATVRAAAKNFIDTDVGYGGAIPSDERLPELVESGTALTQVDPSWVGASAAAIVMRRILMEGRAARESGDVALPLRPLRGVEPAT